MKFKVIFILFNILIAFSVVMVLILPATVFGIDYASQFWKDKWFIGIFFVIVLAGLNVFFARNWKLFSCIEKEDWSGLIGYLEEQIMIKKRISRKKIQLLVNTYLLHAGVHDLRKLSIFLDESKPAVKQQFILQFGIPSLVDNDPESITGYFGRYLHLKTADSEWINWCYSFGLVMQKKIDDSKNNLLALLADCRKPLVKLLTLYLLYSVIYENDSCLAQITKEKDDFSRKYTRGILARELEKSKNNILIVVLLKIINQAIDWLFPPQEARDEQIS
ncbi:MAG: hypothetical protein JW874_04095 [Spirochaetales bacterium]|nr:hypothetical protein [Spirochaetales bacterium]